MPIYEYKCTNCKEIVIKIKKDKDIALCPHCMLHTLEKQFGLPLRGYQAGVYK